jgi:hypothetical protein
MRYLGSDDFLWDSLPVAVWSTVEQCLAITAGCLATLQPLFKTMRNKLGFHTTRSALGNSGSFTVNGEISVRRSFARWTEPSPPSGRQPDPSGPGKGLKLQPGFSEYSATCYNTSQEELRPDVAGTARSVSDHHRKQSKEGFPS